jgi:uncharacterized protein (DUF58 family)
LARIRAGFTTRATCLLAAGATAVLCGLVLGEIDLVRAGVFAAAIPLLAALVVHRSRVRIANRRSVEPTQAEAGGAVTMHLSISNRSVLATGSLLLEDTLPAQLAGHARFVIPGLAGREARTVSYRMPRLSRGRYRAGPLRIRLTDPFHMIDLVRSFSATTDFVVAPVVDALPALEPPRSHDIGDNAGSHSIGTRGADDASTREYRTGDDLRKIHWRSSAHTGALMVRQEERPWQGRTTLLLDLRADAHVAQLRGAIGPDTESGVAPDDVRMRDSAEWAVSAAASIATHLLHAGREVGMVSDLDDAKREHYATARDLVAYLAGARTSRRPDLTPVAGAVRAAARDSAVIAVLGRLDAASLRALADAHPRGSAVPALAMLLDTATWAGDGRDIEHGSGSGVGSGNIDGNGRGNADEDRLADHCAATGRVLTAAGWRVVVVRRGDRVADSWRLLLRGRSATMVTSGAGTAIGGAPR